jgi:hypothetical protein
MTSHCRRLPHIYPENVPFVPHLAASRNFSRIDAAPGRFLVLRTGICVAGPAPGRRAVRANLDYASRYRPHRRRFHPEGRRVRALRSGRVGGHAQSRPSADHTPHFSSPPSEAAERLHCTRRESRVGQDRRAILAERILRPPGAESERVRKDPDLHRNEPREGRPGCGSHAVSLVKRHVILALRQHISGLRTTSSAGQVSRAIR